MRDAPSPSEQALSARLIQEINIGLSWHAASIALQRQLDEACQEIEKLNSANKPAEVGE